MRISDWSSDVCSSDLLSTSLSQRRSEVPTIRLPRPSQNLIREDHKPALIPSNSPRLTRKASCLNWLADPRSEEHTSELQSLMRISYAVFCLKNTTLNIIC